MKRILLRALAVVLAVLPLAVAGCGRSLDFDARWASFEHHMENLSRSIDYHVFNYDWDDPYLP